MDYLFMVRRFSNGTHQACEGDTDSHRNFLLLTGSNKCCLIFFLFLPAK